MNLSTNIGTLHGFIIIYDTNGGVHGGTPIYVFNDERTNLYVSSATANLLPYALEDNGHRMKHAIQKFCNDMNISHRTAMELLMFCQAHYNMIS